MDDPSGIAFMTRIVVDLKMHKLVISFFHNPQVVCKAFIEFEIF